MSYQYNRLKYNHSTSIEMNYFALAFTSYFMYQCGKLFNC